MLAQGSLKTRGRDKRDTPTGCVPHVPRPSLRQGGTSETSRDNVTAVPHVLLRVFRKAFRQDGGKNDPWVGFESTGFSATAINLCGVLVVEVPDSFAIARWPRDADVVTICRCILGTLKFEPHAADTTALRRALERVIEAPQQEEMTR